MSSRDAILNSIRSHDLPPTELPSLNQTWLTYEDPIEQFIEALQAVGGRGIHVRNLEEVNNELSQIEAWQSSEVRCSTVAGAGDPTLDMQTVERPHDLERVDCAVLSGHFAVAENGAVWITDEAIRHRAIYYIT